MSISLVALDYSRPVQPLYEQEPRAGIVHSVFRRAVNIGFGETMLTLLSSELPRMPNGVRISSPAMTELLNGLQPGTPVWIGKRRLFVPCVPFELILPETPPWEPRPVLTLYHWRRSSVVQHVHALAHRLSRQPRDGGLAPLAGPLLLGRTAVMTPLLSTALPLLQLLLRASRKQNTTAIEEAARGLAGLGPGLTPSGDDVLAGFASVMALLSPYAYRGDGPPEDIAEIISSAARPRTTTLSATLLAYAARGEVAEPLGNLLLALARPHEAFSEVLFAAERVLALGGTSGGDMLLGLLLGLRALDHVTYSIGARLCSYGPCSNATPTTTRSLS